jgi:hypothetical protein
VTAQASAAQAPDHAHPPPPRARRPPTPPRARSLSPRADRLPRKKNRLTREYRPVGSVSTTACSSTGGSSPSSSSPPAGPSRSSGSGSGGGTSFSGCVVVAALIFFHRSLCASDARLRRGQIPRSAAARREEWAVRVLRPIGTWLLLRQRCVCVFVRTRGRESRRRRRTRSRPSFAAALSTGGAEDRGVWAGRACDWAHTPRGCGVVWVAPHAREAAGARRCRERRKESVGRLDERFFALTEIFARAERHSQKSPPPHGD